MIYFLNLVLFRFSISGVNFGKLHIIHLISFIKCVNKKVINSIIWNPLKVCRICGDKYIFIFDIGDLYYPLPPPFFSFSFKLRVCQFSWFLSKDPTLTLLYSQSSVFSFYSFLLYFPPTYFVFLLLFFFSPSVKCKVTDLALFSFIW